MWKSQWQPYWVVCAIMFYSLLCIGCVAMSKNAFNFKMVLERVEVRSCTRFKLIISKNKCIRLCSKKMLGEDEDECYLLIIQNYGFFIIETLSFWHYFCHEAIVDVNDFQAMKCCLPFKMRGLKLWGFLTTLGLNFLHARIERDSLIKVYILAWITWNNMWRMWKWICTKFENGHICNWGHQID